MGMELRPIGNSPSASLDLYVEATKVATFKEDGNVELPGKGNLVVDSQVFGIGQTKQDLTSSRLPAVLYTNTSTKPRRISVSVTLGGAGNGARITVEGVACAEEYHQGPNTVRKTLYAIADPGEDYILQYFFGTATINFWVEDVIS